MRVAGLWLPSYNGKMELSPGSPSAGGQKGKSEPKTIGLATPFFSAPSLYDEHSVHISPILERPRHHDPTPPLTQAPNIPLSCLRPGCFNNKVANLTEWSRYDRSIERSWLSYSLPPQAVIGDPMFSYLLNQITPSTPLGPASFTRGYE
jgi:hypothetical protein